jgi:hypothetical protein
VLRIVNSVSSAANKKRKQDLWSDIAENHHQNEKKKKTNEIWRKDT